MTDKRVLALALAGAIACGGSDGGSEAEASPRGGAPAAGGGGVARGGGAGGGGRRAGSITLAGTDVAQVATRAVEESIPITGTLAPADVVEIRARLEGDIDEVTVREGDRVRAGQLLARFEASQQQSAQASMVAAVASARSAVASAQWNLEQSQELFRAGAIPERDQRAAEQSLIAAQAQLAAALAAQRSASSSLSDTRVLSPISGTVSQRSVETGEHVARGAQLFQVVRTDALELAAAVPARRAGVVRVGQLVRFETEGLSLRGSVARVNPTVDPVSRAVMVYARLDNAGGAIKGGSLATGRIVARTVPNALVVPTSAIRNDRDGGSFVYRVAGTPAALDQVKVTLGIVDEASGIAQVETGLSAGDRVVVGNVGTLGRGMRVQIISQDSAARR